MMGGGGGRQMYYSHCLTATDQANHQSIEVATVGNRIVSVVFFGVLGMWCLVVLLRSNV